MMIWTVESGARDDLEQPVKEVFMPDVHTHSDGRLTAVAPETALPDEDAEEKTQLELHRLLFAHWTPLRRGGVVTPYGIT